MEGPYRDLGAGFARLAGAEGARRTPSRISSVEDALLELLRNSRDSGARNIYVASVLRNRRYRTLTVLDDGAGIPKSHTDLVFEPGVTTRHLSPTVQHHDPSPHGAGVSLYHIKDAALDAYVASNANPTSITVTFDTGHTRKGPYSPPPVPQTPTSARRYGNSQKIPRTSASTMQPPHK